MEFKLKRYSLTNKLTGETFAGYLTAKQARCDALKKAWPFVHVGGMTADEYAKAVNEIMVIEEYMETV